jgi:hypothetical protein
MRDGADGHSLKVPPNERDVDRKGHFSGAFR